VELQNRFIAENVTSTCYNIYGDINDPSQLSGLTECAVDIISNVQQGDLYALHVYSII